MLFVPGSLNHSAHYNETSAPKRTLHLAITLAYSVMFAFSLGGNVLTVLVVVSKAYMRSITNCLIANMAIADLLMTVIAMPYSVAFVFVDYRWPGGVVGQITCKLLHFSVMASVAASVTTLVIISVDRFFAVVHPFKRGRVIRKMRVLSAVVWVVSGILASPYLYCYKVEQEADGNSYCFTRWEPLADTFDASRIYYSLIFVFLYVFPLITIAVFYSIVSFKLWIRKIPGNPNAAHRRSDESSKRKIIKMLIVIVIVFALCWLPAHVMHLLFFFHRTEVNHLVSYIAFGISHANSAINPYLYITLNKNFRRAFWDVLIRCFAPARKFARVQSNTVSHTNLARDVSADYVEVADLVGRSGVYELSKVVTGGASEACHRPINLLKVTANGSMQTNVP